MNLTVAHQETTISATSLILQGDSFSRIMEMAEVMASGMVSVPKHFQKNKGDCAAIIMQAMQWNMNPYLVAQKTFMDPGGKISYEAQLVNAVINSVGPLDGRPRYEHIGNWEKIRGRVKEMAGADNKGKYYVRDWPASDEVGLGVICHYKIIGESDPRQYKLMLSQCWPRFSTQWATDPEQQICFLAIKKVARRDFSDVILGVYTPDELDSFSSERDITPPTGNIPTGETTTDAPEKLPDYPAVPFENSFPKWKISVEKGDTTTAEWIKTLSKKGTLTVEQLNRINEIREPIKGEVV